MLEFEDIMSGFKINFHFEENPYFENRILTKEYHLKSFGNFRKFKEENNIFKVNILVIDNPQSKSTTIKWKEGFDLVQTKHTPLKTGQKRGSEHKSFFSWFNDHSDPISDDIAEIIKDDIYLNPLQYFLVPDVGVDNGVDDDEGSDQDDDIEEQGAGTTGDTDEDTHDVQNSGISTNN